MCIWDETQGGDGTAMASAASGGIAREAPASRPGGEVDGSGERAVSDRAPFSGTCREPVAREPRENRVPGWTVLRVPSPPPPASRPANPHYRPAESRRRNRPVKGARGPNQSGARRHLRAGTDARQRASGSRRREAPDHPWRGDYLGRGSRGFPEISSMNPKKIMARAADERAGVGPGRCTRQAGAAAGPVQAVSTFGNRGAGLPSISSAVTRSDGSRGGSAASA